MRVIFLKILAFILLLMPMVVFAHETNRAHVGTNDKVHSEPAVTTAPDPWDGSKASLGFVNTTGNTNTLSLAAGLNIDYTRGRLNDVAILNAEYGRDNGIVNKEKYFAQNQLSYFFNGKRTHYVFLNNNLTADQFSPYVYQTVSSVGYGRDIIHSSNFKWSIQTGPGYRNDKERGSDRMNGHVILTTTTSIIWQLTKRGVLSEVLRYDYGEPYNYLKSVSSFINKVIGNLAVEVSYTVENYSKIPRLSTRTKKTDTTTNVALVYTF